MALPSTLQRFCGVFAPAIHTQTGYVRVGQAVYHHVTVHMDMQLTARRSRS